MVTRSKEETGLRTDQVKNNNSSSNSSIRSNPSTWDKKDEDPNANNEESGEMWNGRSKFSHSEYKDTSNNEQHQQTLPPYTITTASRSIFANPPRQFNNSDPKDVQFIGPSKLAASRERFEPGVNSPRRVAGNNIVYAELQLPRASNNGSLKGASTGPKIPLNRPLRRTQYAEITFQRERQPLQSAHI